MKFLYRLLCVMSGLILANLAAAGSPLPHQSPDKTLGTVNCATSTCHGSMNAWEGNVLRNEYTTWTRLDKHTRAYAVLRNAESQRIMQNLGLKESATEAQICLDCHAHNPPAAQRDARFDQTEGVGCEGCHGPAERWIGTHTRKDTPHGENLARGMYPTDNPISQATLCLSCHFGDRSRYVNHHIMGAGHPRISFDLATFSALEPAHHRVDDDYARRKGAPDPVRLWAVGQLLAARQLLDTLVDPKLGRDGMFPELTLFDCHSCHHPMSAKRWRPRMGLGSGRMRLNDSNLLMARAVVHVLSDESGAEFDHAVRATQQAVASGRGPAGEDPLVLARALSARLTTLLPRVAAMHFPPATQRALLLALVDQIMASDYSDYAGAEQAYMGIVSVTNDLLARGALVDAPTLRADLKAMLIALQRDEAFQPEVYAQALKSFRVHVSSQVKPS